MMIHRGDSGWRVLVDQRQVGRKLKHNQHEPPVLCSLRVTNAGQRRGIWIIRRSTKWFFFGLVVRLLEDARCTVRDRPIMGHVLMNRKQHLITGYWTVDSEITSSREKRRSLIERIMVLYLSLLRDSCIMEAILQNPWYL